MPTPARPDHDDCERQLLAFADALPVGVVLVDTGRVRALNAYAAHQFGCDPDRIAGTRLEALLGDDATHWLDTATDDGARTRVDLRRVDGATFPAEIGNRALRIGAHDFTLLFVCDVTENERIRDELAQQHERLQAMARRLLSVQEDERRTLSRELHDDIGQQVTAIKLAALALRDEADATRRADIVAEIVGATDQTLAKVRDLSLLLRPPQLDALGLEAALRWQAGVMFRNGPPRLELGIEPLADRPSPEAELACFRIAQEALTNVLRHARAHSVELTLALSAGRLVLDVRDDGCGFALDAATGLGLVTMHERAQQLGGRFSIDSALGRGTHVHAEVPCA
jgi:signal transduction histidine kinase